MEQTARRTRKRYKQETSLKTRLEDAARASREAARATPSVNKREALLRAARQYEMAAHLDEWLSSPGLQRPT